ncbi:hypothetical protein SEA_ARTORIAS_6 [Gordonia phage Artorias]|nr:hypothetical protein SEA_ARTORIAS_6 [Gordonia phage Artorias]
MTFLQAVGLNTPQTYRMVKTGSNQAGVGTSYNAVTNMVVDSATDPDAVINGAIIIPYDAEPYMAVISGQIDWTGGIAPSVGCRIRKSGSDLVTGSLTGSTEATATTTIMVYPGDSFDLWWRGEGSFFNRPSCKPGELTFLKVVPQ